MSDARRALAFLTPLGGAAVPTPGALGWFPVVGAAIGAVLGAAWWGASQAFAPALAASIVVCLDLAMTGMLHLDGLVDSADGLLPHLDRERRLVVLREPTIGAFGMAVGAGTLLVRWSALFALRPSVLVVVALWTASRTAMAVVATVCPYARPAGEGLARAFLGSRGAGVASALVGTAGSLAAAVAYRPLAGPVALGSGAVAAVGVVTLAVRRLGGFTGDVLGAAGVVLETVGLVVAAARW